MARLQVDHNAVKFGQVVIVLTVAAAWLADRAPLIALLAVILLTNVAWPAAGPLRLAYRYLVLPLRVVRPNVVADDPAPHRFAQGFGGGVLLAATAVLYGGWPAPGWILAAAVAVLAAVNVFWNFCAGCFLFFQLRRLGLWRGAPAG